MENFKVSLSVHDIVLLTLILSFSGFKIVNGQINTACTSSIISTFTPCFNYLTGSSGNGSSPTEDCCNSLKSSMSDSIDCVCLIVTGNVPVSIPFIRTLALSLPQACNTGVPVQCSGTINLIHGFILSGILCFDYMTKLSLICLLFVASGVPLPSPGMYIKTLSESLIFQ